MTNHTLSHIVLRAASALLLVAFCAALPAAAADAPAGVVNVNTATAEQLALLPRIGPAIAQRIVELRKSDGPFKGPEDLMLVRGIGESTFALMKGYVVVKGETTLTTKVRAPRRPSAQERR